MAGAVIRANRAEVNDRFPMLGFTVRTGSRPYFEAVVTTDPTLLSAERRGEREPGSFWSSRGLGPLPAERGEAVFIVPDKVLRRFAGANRLFYAVATFTDRTRGNPEVTRIAPDLAPFVMLSPGYTGRRLRQLVGGGGDTVRWNGAGTRYADNDQESLEWAGDSGQPGVESPAGNGNGGPRVDAESGTVSAGLSYDDGYGEKLWQETQRRAGRSRGLSDTGFDIAWGDVPLVSEDLTVPGWLASAAMLVGWRNLRPPNPRELLALLSGIVAGSVDGLTAGNVATIAKALGLEPESPASYSVESLRQLIATRGPQWIGVAEVPPRFVVATGIYGDGTPSGTFVRLSDPTGHPLGATQPTLGGMATSYVLTFQQFLDAFAAIAPGAGLQAIHVTEADMQGRAPLVTSQASALAARRRPVGRQASVARAHAVPAIVPIVSAIVGATMTRILNNEGDISWQLDQLKGLKHPGDDASRSGTANFKTVVTPVKGWPVIKGGIHEVDALSDWIYADFELEWQCNGHSVGNVAIKNTHNNDAVGHGLVVDAKINDDATVYEGDQAAIRVSFNYQFSRTIGSNAVAIRDFTLYADGTFNEEQRWTQKPDGWWGSEEQSLSRGQSVGAAVAGPIVETLLKFFIDNLEGDIDVELPELDGWKHIRDDASTRKAGQERVVTKAIEGPGLEIGFGITDEISCDLLVTWSCDGSSLGNIRVRPKDPNDALGWGLKVKGEVYNDPGVYTSNGSDQFAAIRLLFTYHFDGAGDEVRNFDVMLYGNGTYDVIRHY